MKDGSFFVAITTTFSNRVSLKLVKNEREASFFSKLHLYRFFKVEIWKATLPNLSPIGPKFRPELKMANFRTGYLNLACLHLLMRNAIFYRLSKNARQLFKLKIAIKICSPTSHTVLSHCFTECTCARENAFFV